MTKIIDVCPFVGLTYEDENGVKHTRGEGLTQEDNDRLDKAFKPYFGKSLKRKAAIQLAQKALEGKSG